MGKQAQDTTRRHAVVIGASMGGLVAAAALARSFEQVTILERDALADTPQHRRGVPQSKHAHGLQPGGVRAIDELLPGVMADLMALGMPSGDVTGDCTWVMGGQRFARADAGIRTVGVTRPFLEHQVRARVAALPGVTIRDEVEVRGLLAADPRLVTGVEIATADRVERIAADLVVDASGKVSKLPQWLAALGYATPDEESVTCKMAYLSRRWRLSATTAHTDIVTVITPTASPHFGVAIAQEDGTYIVTVGGLLDSGPRRTDADYLEFAAKLPDPAIADLLVGATPVTDLQPSHFPASRRRRYDKLRSFPAGLLALGDSIASFNPMYGQGMTVAALQAVALRDMLARGLLDARKFFRRAHRIEDVAWKIAASGDLRFDAVEGSRTPDMKLMNAYLDRLTAAANTDPVLARQFVRVAGFMAGPQTFFAPSILWRVLVRRGKVPTPQPVGAVRSEAVENRAA